MSTWSIQMSSLKDQTVRRYRETNSYHLPGLCAGGSAAVVGVVNSALLPAVVLDTAVAWTSRMSWNMQAIGELRQYDCGCMIVSATRRAACGCGVCIAADGKWGSATAKTMRRCSSCWLNKGGNWTKRRRAAWGMADEDDAVGGNDGGNEPRRRRHRRRSAAVKGEVGMIGGGI